MSAWPAEKKAFGDHPLWPVVGAPGACLDPARIGALWRREMIIKPKFLRKNKLIIRTISGFMTHAGCGGSGYKVRDTPKRSRAFLWREVGVVMRSKVKAAEPS